MHILLAVILTQLIGMYAKPQWALPLYKTKVPFYKFRGEFHVPKKPQDYCVPGLCPRGERHIMCNQLFWGKNCLKPRLGVNMDKYKTEILSYHNNLRNRLFNDLGNLPAAKRLPLLVWDEELSIVAMRVTNFCNDESFCRCLNVPRYLNVARNSHVHWYLKQSMSDLLKQIIYSLWTRHFPRFPPAYVHKFPENATELDKQFANMIYQNITHIGCGMLVHEIKNLTTCYFTCLYNEKIKPGQRLYDVKIQN